MLFFTVGMIGGRILSSVFSEDETDEDSQENDEAEYTDESIGLTSTLYIFPFSNF